MYSVIMLNICDLQITCTNCYVIYVHDFCFFRWGELLRVPNKWYFIIIIYSRYLFLKKGSKLVQKYFIIFLMTPLHNQMWLNVSIVLTGTFKYACSRIILPCASADCILRQYRRVVICSGKAQLIFPPFLRLFGNNTRLW